jgi:3-hydroxybutyryl-CoA dehydrogenase
MKIARVGVVGCGVMGSGIAQLSAMKGYGVVVCEKSEIILHKGMSSIKKELLKLAKGGKLSNDDAEDIFGEIESTTTFDAFSTCDLVIEAVTEDLELKKRIFREIDSICPEHTILATNTSVLPVIEMARATSRPEKVLGTHFLTPPPVIPLLEIVRTLMTGEETLKEITDFGRSLGKRVVVSKDRPGFIVNRVLTSIMFNAVRLLEEGIADKESIDTAMEVGLGLPMGPLRLLDLIGMDTVVLGSDALLRELNDPQYACPISIRRMVSAGWLGRKTGKGFYEYND